MKEQKQNFLMAIALLIVLAIVISVYAGTRISGRKYIFTDEPTPTPTLSVVMDEEQWEPIGTDGAKFKNSKTGEIKSYYELQENIGR